MKQKNKKITTKKLEKFVMHLEDVTLAKVEHLALKAGCTKSWIYRAILVAIEKKFPEELPQKIIIQRPKKFQSSFRQTTICMYGDKAKWFSLCRIWMVELGPLIRYALDLFEKGELEIDLEDEASTKIIKYSLPGKLKKSSIDKKRYRYQYQNYNQVYDSYDYWLKDPKKNILLMKRGLENRKVPLIVPINFKIPKCFGG